MTARQSKISDIVKHLLEWYSRNARDLPWRRTPDPYGIFVSEIMLQQTQVKTVLPYWERWMRELPSVQDLADASPKRIHKLWEGLGYYTRVRNMQRAAQLIVEYHDGRFPEAFEQVRELPGIGRYTAGAICSIAFNQPKPVLDGNVIRVLARVFGIRGNPRQRAVNERLWDLAEHLVLAASTENSDRGAQHNCGDLNQSMMELGATICTSRDPQCGICPIAFHCVAHRTRRAHLLPCVPPRPRATARLFYAFVIEKQGKYLVRQRPGGTVNAYLWEFPNIEIKEAGSLSKALRKTLGTDGTDGTEVEHWFDIRHSITRYRITLRVFRLKAKSKAMNGRWVGSRGLSRLAFPSAHKKILGRLPGRGRKSMLARSPELNPRGRKEKKL